MILYARYASPLGTLVLDSRGAGLAGLTMEHHRHARPLAPDALERPAAFDDVRRQLDEYFLGKRTRFDLTLDLVGTPFQRRVWAALGAIPFGHTTSYGALAVALGAPGAARAVGHSNARNPVSIIVPCHRVIGASGALTGYAGGERRKRWLLDLEAGRAGVVAA